MKKQVSAILENLQSNVYTSLDQYRHEAYTTGFVGTMYDLHYQGVPLLIPINRDAVLKAVQHDTKLSSPLYDALGIDTRVMTKKISKELSRGLATGLTYDEIARNIRNTTKAPLARARAIARTEGHRIQQASAADARTEAKAKGADVVKQWDATLDGDTRENHRQLDGQIREIEEPFEVGSYKPMHPGDFGDPAEDCNCRCVALTRARAALDEDELKTLKERAEYFGIDKSDSFTDFEKKYLKAAENVDNSGKSGIISADVYDPSSGEYFKFAKGTKILNPKVFAGKGGVKPLREEVAEGLSQEFGGTPSNWQHAKGIGTLDYFGEELEAEVHWFQEETVGKVKFKVKEWIE